MKINFHQQVSQSFYLTTTCQSMNFLRYRAASFWTYRYFRCSIATYRYFVGRRSTATRSYEFTIHPWIQFSLSIVSISYTSGNLSRDYYILFIYYIYKERKYWRNTHSTKNINRYFCSSSCSIITIFHDLWICSWKYACTYLNCVNLYIKCIHKYINHIHLMILKWYVYVTDYITSHNNLKIREKMYRQLFEMEENLRLYIEWETKSEWETKIHWIAYRECGERTTYIRTARLRSKESMKWKDGLCVI